MKDNPENEKLRDNKNRAAEILLKEGWTRIEIYDVLEGRLDDGNEAGRIVDRLRKEVSNSMRCIVQGQPVGQAVMITTKDVLEAARMILDRLDPIITKMQVDTRQSVMVLDEREEIELNKKLGLPAPWRGQTEVIG